MQLWRVFPVLAAAHFSVSVSAQQLEVISKPYQPAQYGLGSSSAIVLSADGEWAVFVSDANNLVTNDNNGLVLDVFLKSLETGQITLLSANTNRSNGGDGDSSFAIVSETGRYVVFQSDASDLVPGDTNEQMDLFLWDNSGGTLRLITKVNGEAADGSSGYPSMTPDGKYIAFESDASNLVSTDSNESADVFLYSRETGEITLVTQNVQNNDSAVGGPSLWLLGTLEPAVSPDGRFVAFASPATNLVTAAFASNHAHYLVYLRDTLGRTNRLIARYLSNNAPATKPSATPMFSGNGRKLVFLSEANLLHHGIFLSGNALFSYDLEIGSLERVGPESNQSPPSGWHEDFSVSHDGDVAYVLQSQSGVFQHQVWLWTGSTNRVVSLNTNNTPASGVSDEPFISADGSKVVFVSSATDIQPLPTHGAFQLYRVDLQTGEKQLLSRDAANSSGSTTDILFPDISVNADVVAFESFDSNLPSPGPNNASDVFVVKGTNAPETLSLGNPASASVTANNQSSLNPGALSLDGRSLVFTSQASDLVPNDTNRQPDVFLRNLQLGAMIRVSVDSDGNEANGSSDNPVISADGRFVAFTSLATDLVANDTNKVQDIFLRDVQSAETHLVSIDGGVSSAERPAISADGSRIAYVRFASGLLRVYLRDVSEDTIQEVGTPHRADGWILSPDGNLLGVHTQFQLRIVDLTAMQTNTLVTNSAVTLHGFSDDSARLLYSLFSSTRSTYGYVYDHALGQSLLTFTNMGRASLSPNGRYVAAETPLERNTGLTELSLYDTATQSSRRIFPPEGITNRRALSLPPSFSRDGTRLAFASRITNALGDDTTEFSDVYLADVGTGEVRLISRNTNSVAGNAVSTQPILSRDGRHLYFHSGASDLIARDKNSTIDIFVATLPSLDSDNDGLADNWELLIFGNLNQTGTTDADEDGFVNAAEFRAGTDPISANSLLMIAAESAEEGVTLRWPAVPGMRYDVQVSDQLSASWTTSDTLVATSNQATLTEPNPASEQRFYRVVVAQ